MANNAPPDPIPLLMTRPRAASQAFVDNLPQEMRARLSPVYSPLIKIQKIKAIAPLLADDAPIFTSTNGVLHGPKGQGQPAYCVGAATVKAAQSAGWAARLSGDTADGLVADLMQNPPHQRLIHLSGVHTRGDIITRLVAQGIAARKIAVYDQITQPLDATARALIANDTPLLAPLFSPRTSAQFAVEAPRAANVFVIALSYAVAQCLEASSYAGITVASAPNADAMISAIAAALSDLPAG